MTTPDERYNALVYARDFMRALQDPKETPRVPMDIRKWASRCLRHYPNEPFYDILREKAPDILGVAPIRDIEKENEEFMRKKK